MRLNQITIPCVDYAESAVALDQHVSELEREGFRFDSLPQDQRWMGHSQTALRKRSKHSSGEADRRTLQ